MTTRSFTDVVNGKNRLILIIDDPDDNIKTKLDAIFSEPKPLPATDPIFTEEHVEEVDTIWGDDDEEAGMLKSISEQYGRKVKVPKDADMAWFYKELITDSAVSTLQRIDGMLYHFRDKKMPDGYRQAVAYLLSKMKGTNSIKEDWTKSLQSLSHISKEYLEKIRIENEVLTFAEWYFQQVEDTQKEVLGETLDHIIRMMQR